eukprot:PITA_05923
MEEEISNVVWSMELDKAPGPDGFSIHFYKICWELIESDLLRMIRGFMRKEKVGGGINSTFLTLIPKEANPGSFHRYRMISLCNSSYKILAKLLANRIKPLLQKLISPVHGGFLKGRHILDNVIQVQEALHSIRSHKEQGVLIKLDMCNAFDRVNRSFLYRVLSSFGFNQDFINLIKAGLEKIWITPMVNGRPTYFFLDTRGLRQGYPLSPFLYILMADSLSKKLTLEKQNGNILGIRIVKGIAPVNHALFVDDSLLLGGASLRIVNSFITILQKFCSISRALISERKSVVYGWNTKQHAIDRIVSDLGFNGHAYWDRVKYLGLPIMMGSNINHLWEEVISKFKKTIAAWGGFWLTTGGKVILIRSVLSTLPTFQASLMMAPKEILDQISSLMHNFLRNGEHGNSNRFHLINWETTKRPLKEGDLQIRDPLQENLALGFKLLWKLFAEPNHPISQILKIKYLKNQSIKSFIPEKVPKGTQAWKLCNKGIKIFRSHMYRIPGNGKITLLWRDRFMGHPPLTKNNEILELRFWLHTKAIWKIEDISVHKGNEDSWGWGKTGVYTASQGYLQMQMKKDLSHLKSVWKQVWDSFSIPKINFFFWTLFHNKILIGENMCRRNIVGPHQCALRKNALENLEHMFIDCEYAKKAWSIFLTRLNVRPTTQCSIADMFSTWKASYPHNIDSKSLWHKVWIAAPKYVCWKLWLAQKEIIFKHNETPTEEVAD